jgi:hypothetical protein
MKRMGEAMDGTVDYLARRLGNAYDSFLKTAPTNSYAVMDEEGWRLSGSFFSTTLFTVLGWHD